MERAYSLLTVKSVDDDEWVIEGIASTPSADRMGDEVMPLGAKFSIPMPLLWQHDSKKPVGEVTFASPTEKGIPFRAAIKKAADFTSETLRERALEAWESVKHGLVRGVSIGFKDLESEIIKGTFGIRFLEWEWLELSLVTIPANSQATITTVKSIDAQLLAASGREPTPPGASGSVKLILKQHPRGANMTITEQISAFENTRAAKAARRSEIQDKASKEGRSKDEAERQEFDTITDELKSIDKELVDLRVMEAENVASAKPVDATNTEKAAESRGPRITVKADEKLEKGIEFARYAMCVAAAKGNMPQALELAKTHYPQQTRAINVIKAATERGTSVEKLLMQQKAAVAAGTTTDATWASPLLAYNTFAGDFVEYLRAQTILGQFGQNGVPDLRRIPFNVHIKGQTSGGTGYWVGQGKAKPVTKYDFNDTYHGFTKVAAIAVLTEELIRFSDPSAERLVRDALSGSLIERIDTDFIDPNKAISSGVSPASITNGVSAITSGGTTADDVRSDIQALWAAGIAANLPLTSAVYITTPSIALALSLMMNALGQPEFSGMTMRGGNLMGVPVVVSNYVPAGTFVLVYASEIYLSDDGNVTVDASTQASIEMDNAPAGDSGAGTGASLVSMYQTDSVALRAHRFISWSKRRATAVALVEDVAWGGASPS